MLNYMKAQTWPDTTIGYFAVIDTIRNIEIEQSIARHSPKVIPRYREYLTPMLSSTRSVVLNAGYRSTQQLPTTSPSALIHRGVT